jgi:quercetin dioxygenase-like cupin family protein
MYFNVFDMLSRARKTLNECVSSATYMEKRFIIAFEDAKTGVLHGGQGIFRILIDKKTTGANNFSMLVNTSKAGTRGSEHRHDVEHGFYILSGTGTIYLDGKPREISPRKAIFVPAGTLHRIDVDQEADLTYMVIYAPPGPEEELTQKGEHAFETY